ncbi:NERD domain-containing protein [Faecalibacillus intestinalis]|uniref:NERD domain-containing protein n=1 Tax=Faecalibacillus intestinalis TaxID=1982626 RepID=UPI00295E69FF|nr:NERD domain-containing protein [Faecalibacillus intestinalis]
MEVIVMYSIGLIVISFIIAVTKSKLKGKAGEVTVNHLLKKLNSNEYIIINDFLLHNEGNTKTTQIDHAVISLYGIFSIETKNYKGQIYGNTYSKQWTQNIYGKKYCFMNPIRQNYAHVKSIESFLCKYGYDNIPVYSIIAFPGGATLKLKIKDENVVKWAEVVKTIKKLSKEKYLTKNEIRNISKLLNNQKNNILDNRKHISQIKEVKRKQENINHNICPRCGSQLVIRNGKYGQFIGCSNYPKCKFTAKIDI